MANLTSNPIFTKKDISVFADGVISYTDKKFIPIMIDTTQEIYDYLEKAQEVYDTAKERLHELENKILNDVQITKKDCSHLWFLLTESSDGDHHRPCISYISYCPICGELSDLDDRPKLDFHIDFNVTKINQFKYIKQYTNLPYDVIYNSIKDESDD